MEDIIEALLTSARDDASGAGMRLAGLLARSADLSLLLASDDSIEEVLCSLDATTQRRCATWHGQTLEDSLPRPQARALRALARAARPRLPRPSSRR